MTIFDPINYLKIRNQLDLSRANFAEMCQLSDRTLYALESNKKVSINTHKCLINFFINHGLVEPELVVPLVIEWIRCFDLNQELHLTQMSPEIIKRQIELTHAVFIAQNPEEHQRVMDLFLRCRR